MSTDRLSQCRWPPLASPFDAALREAVGFILGEVWPVGIIATGTIVRGESKASSDLDVYVIHEGAFRRRVQRFFRGVPAEILINPPHAIRGYFEEEHRDGRPITAHMLVTGFVVYASSPVVDELRVEAGEWLRRTIRPFDGEVTRARYAAATLVEDGADVVEADGPTATMILGEAVVAMLELFCRTRIGRVPRRKELLAIVRGHDVETGDLAGAFFNAATPRERREFAEALADRILGARGFFEWDSGPSPLPPPVHRGTTDASTAPVE